MRANGFWVKAILKGVLILPFTKEKQMMYKFRIM